MTKGRLEAFSDGVIAIIITIMVLELRPPEHGADLHALQPLLPAFLTYALSFVYLAIYWNNHHHLLHATDRIDGRVMWANAHLLFWLSLIPFGTAWAGENHEAAMPAALYGAILLMAGVAYVILQRAICSIPANGRLRDAVGADMKGKASMLAYMAAIGLAFVNQWIADAIYVGIAMMWLVPDRRIEHRLAGERP